MPTILRRLLAEPTVHFGLLALGLFALHALFTAGTGDVLELDAAELEWRVQRAELARGSALDPGERARVEESYIREQVLVREALALGLQHDERIDDILVQKMLHVLSADVIQPTDAELLAHYDANRARYAPGWTVTVDELIVATAEPLPVSVQEQLRQGLAPERLVSDLPGSRGVLPEVTITDLTAIFGPVTARLVFDADSGSWVGPHHTVRGQHWFRVAHRTVSEPEPLDAIREQVRLDWIADEEEARLERRVAELRSRYSVVFTGRATLP